MPLFREASGTNVLCNGLTRCDQIDQDICACSIRCKTGRKGMDRQNFILVLKRTDFVAVRVNRIQKKGMIFCPQLKDVYIASENAASVLGNTVYVRILKPAHYLGFVKNWVIYKRLQDGAIKFIQVLQDIKFVSGFPVGNAIFFLTLQKGIFLAIVFLYSLRNRISCR